MSHANGRVYKNNIVVAHFEYNGTCDVVCPAMHKTYDEMLAVWRTGENYRECTCGKPSEPVVLYTDYGGGFHWDGAACFNCMAITDGIAVYARDVPYTDGEPFVDITLQGLLGGL